MAHYAELNNNNEVIYVIYMDNDIITDENGNEVEDLGIQHLHTHHGSSRRWVRTSYNGNFRNKYAGVGDTYIEDLDIFVSPKPFESWVLNETSGQWDPPIPMPDLTEEQKNDETYHYGFSWNEETQIWDAFKVEKDPNVP